MRILVAIVGFVAAIGLLAVSMSMNFQFGRTLGRDEINGWIYGVASVCGDGLKALLPFAIGWAWAERRWLVAFAGALLFAVATAYSLTSALGFAAQNRSAKSGDATAQAALYRDLAAERERLIAERDAQAPHRPKASLEAELSALRQHRRWSSTSGCTDATVPQSIEYCERYFAIQAELGVADRAGEINARLEEIRAALAALPASAAAGETDPQVAALSDLLVLPEDSARLALLLLVTAFVEFGSGFGFYATVSHVRRRTASAANPRGSRQEQPTSPSAAAPAPMARDDAAWVEERLAPAPGRSTPLTELFADYASWRRGRAQRGGLAPTELAAFLESNGIARARLGGREVFRDVKLTDARQGA